MMNSGESTAARASLAPLTVDQLYRRTNPSALPFKTTAELEPKDGLAGQKRAFDAISFGTKIRGAGFNLFVIGPTGAGMKPVVESVVKEIARDRPSPADWVYVNNFAEPHRPVAIMLPPGRAVDFRNGMRELIDELKSTLPAVFEAEDYQTRRGAIEANYHQKQEEAFSGLKLKAEAQGIVILRTPLGFALAPATKEGGVVPPEEFNSWPEEKREATQAIIKELEKDLEKIVRQLPQWEKQKREELRKLNEETVQLAVGQTIEEVRARFSGLPTVTDHLEKVSTDLVSNAAMFITTATDETEGAAVPKRASGPFGRYEVNILVTQAGQARGAPVIEEAHPTLSNLIGRVEYVSQQGALVTDFRLIKAGALHRANGGYLLIDARALLSEPFSWTVLKRALRQGQIVIEDVARFLGLTSTISLQPDPVPLDIKVVLFGDRLLYYLLAQFDPELAEHFKVLADFEAAPAKAFSSSVAVFQDLRGLPLNAIAFIRRILSWPSPSLRGDRL